MPLKYALSLVFTIALCLKAGPSAAASFDCTKAATPVEQILCADQELGTLDERMAEAYRIAKAAASDNPEERKALVTEQRRWLKQRNACSSPVCIGRLYEERIRILSGQAAAPMERVEIRETGPHYGIEAKFPQLKGADKAVQSTNGEIRKFVGEILASFRQGVIEDLADLVEDASDPANDWEVHDWQLIVDNDMPHRTDRYLAIPFSGSDYRGGAHGMPLMAVLVIDLATGSPLPNTRLFTPGTDWLDYLSERCYNALKRQFKDADLDIDDDWLRGGTAPKPENYSLLFPGPEGITVLFPPYQVAPYALGPQEVLVPYADLRGLLNSQLFGY